MTDELSPEAERAIQLEERAHRLRMMMLRTPDLVEQLRESYEAAERGETYTLEELDRTLDWT